jgi:CBS domain-containing membrane protein
MIRLQVHDLMTRNVIVLQPQDAAAAVLDLMSERRIRHVPVVDAQGDLVGVVSQRDLLGSPLLHRSDLPPAAAMEALRHVKVVDLMTPEPVTVGPDADIRTAAQIMLDHKYGCLPVTEGRRLVGILTEADFVRLLAQGE